MLGPYVIMEFFFTRIEVARDNKWSLVLLFRNIQYREYTFRQSVIEVTVDDVISVKAPSTGVSDVIYTGQVLVPREILAVVDVHRQLLVGVEFVDEGFVAKQLCHFEDVVLVCIHSHQECQGIEHIGTNQLK